MGGLVGVFEDWELSEGAREGAFDVFSAGLDVKALVGAFENSLADCFESEAMNAGGKISQLLWFLWNV